MFEEVRICGLGSIDEAVLELHPRLTVLSGETGAGKSSVIKAFGLLAGGRGDPGAVRAGHSCAAVEARLQAPPGSALAERAAELGGVVEHGSVLITRTVSVDGRSRAYVGGRAVPVGVLAELVGGVLALHGQSGQLRLKHTAAQRAALDRFVGPPVLAPLESYRRTRAEWLEVRTSRELLQSREAESAREVEMLRLGLADVERVAPLPAEDVELDRELVRLGAADELRCAGDAARTAMVGSDASVAGCDDGGALAGLVQAARALDAAAAADPELGSLALRAHEVCMLTTELVGDLCSYVDGVESDGPRLEAAQARRAELNRLCRPHNTDVDGVLRWAAEAGLRLLDLDGGGERAAELAAAELRLGEQMLAHAREVSEARRDGAGRLAARVTGELDALSMPSAVFDVVVTAAAESGPDGADDVEYLFSAGTGVALRPLSRAASGGELSRIVLALEVVLAGGSDAQAMVFDEVDAGVGGEAASEIGRRLARLAEHAQVVCVTHLSQVAAFADQHLLVRKLQEGSTGVQHSTVRLLERPERVRELSRMLGGVAESRLAQGHADELLTCADEAKQAKPVPPRRPGARRPRTAQRVVRGAA